MVRRYAGTVRHILATLVLAALTAATPAQAPTAAAKRPPNIVLLFSDDAGFADFGFQEHAAADAKPLTPNLDALATGGVRCTDAYVSGAVCSPSRAGLLTGRYQQRFGHERNIPAGYQKGGMDLGEKTVADHLRAIGYRTALVGKWHLGYPEQYRPNERGFGDFWGLLQGSRNYVPLPKPSFDQVLQHNGKPLPEGGHVTERLGEFAAEYVKAHREQPFFLMVSFTATHGPLQPADRDLAEVPEQVEQRRRKNLGLLVGLDRAVGKILAAIDDAGLADDTLVVFSNDNGGQTQTGADNGPLRGRKGMLFEGGVRVPLLARWPSRIPAGTVAREPMILLDLLPTFVVAAGSQPSAEWRLDGTDLLPRWTGAEATLPERSLFWRTSGKNGPVAMRKGAWKLVWNRQEADPTPRLFDLATDLGEARDRSAEEPKRLRAMLAELAAWEAELAEPRW
ncbi:MAG: Arylsulfatase [Planctomycetota bacterium]|jgi:arylsulfatase A-like enzyme